MTEGTQSSRSLLELYISGPIMLETHCHAIIHMSYKKNYEYEIYPQVEDNCRKIEPLHTRSQINRDIITIEIQSLGSFRGDVWRSGGWLVRLLRFLSDTPYHAIDLRSFVWSILQRTSPKTSPTSQLKLQNSFIDQMPTQLRSRGGWNRAPQSQSPATVQSSREEELWNKEALIHKQGGHGDGRQIQTLDLVKDAREWWYREINFT
jgi:hypothetical protein